MTHKNKIISIVLVAIVLVLAASTTIFLKYSLDTYFDDVRLSGVASPTRNEIPETTATCSAPASYPAQPVYVNKQVLWRVTVSSQEYNINSLWYTPVFDGVAGASVKINGGTFDVAKTYGTIGKKRFSINVTHGGSTVGSCDETSILVKVNPKLMNR